MNQNSFNSRKKVFAITSAIIALLLTGINISNTDIIIAGWLMVVIAYIKLRFDDCEIWDTGIRCGLSFTMLSAFLFISSLSDSVTALIFASVVCTLIYVFGTYILDAINLRKANEFVGCNSFYFWPIYFTFVVVFVYSSDLESKYQKEYEKEYETAIYIGIEKIEKETYNGNTYFMVTTENGDFFGVNPRVYPEIRTASDENKIKYVLEKYHQDNILIVHKLELK